MKIKFIAYLMLTFFLTSCEDIVDVELEQGETALVVEGWITTEEEPYTIHLSKTGPYFESGAKPAVQGAHVVITDSEGNRDSLTEVNPGSYSTVSKRIGKVGNTYTLNITAEGERYTASTEIKRVPPIDSLVPVFDDIEEPDDIGYYIQLYGPELPGVGDYYKFRATKNDTVLNRPGDVWNITSDEWVDGNYISGIELMGPLKDGDKAKIELMSITKEAYNFYVELATQVNNGGMFANPPANVKSNIINLNPESKKRVVGFFGGSAISSMEITIPDKK